MEKLKIGFDLDGVIYPWHELVYNYLKETIKLKASFSEFWKDPTNYVSKELIYSFEIDPVFMSKCYPKHDDLLLIQNLAKNFEIFYITARKPQVSVATKTWIKHHKFPYPENLIIVNKSKVEPVIENNIKIFVEDRDKYAIELRDYCEVFLIKKPWNEHIQNEFVCLNQLAELANFLDVYNKKI